MPKDFVVPVRRTAPGEEEVGRHEKLGFQWGLYQGEGRKELSSTMGLTDTEQRQGMGSGPRG